VAVAGEKGQVQSVVGLGEEEQQGLLNTHPDTSNMEYSPKQAEPAW